jgi:peptidyl-prolyl cis-trans isomerase SurA
VTLRAAVMTAWSLAALLKGAVATSLAGQVPGGEEGPVDRIVAVVGSAAITYTQLQEEYYSRYTFTGRQPPTDPEQVRAEMRPLLDTLINDELIYQQALRDTMIEVTPLEISDAVDEVMRNTRRQFETEAAFLAELRRAGFLGIDDYRRWMMERQGRELLKNRFEQSIREAGVLVPLNPTEREVRQYYDDHRDQLPVRPASVSLRQVVVRPRADSAARLRAFALADSLARAIRAGADFAVVARRFSDDPGSAQNGGDLGWKRSGDFVREFERVAFSLSLGTISNPVETPFGFHVIQVERIQPTEVKTRHILIAPAIDSAGVAEAERLARDLHARVLVGASFDSVQAIHHDMAEEREALGVPIDSLPPMYRDALAGVDSGRVSDVFVLAIEGADVPPKFAFVKVTGRAPAGPRPYDQIRESIRRGLAEAMGQEKYLAELRRKTYVDTREP